MHRQAFRSARFGLVLGSGLALVLSAGDVHAQVAGSTSRPLPNVLLLVDNSGSMERKPGDNLPPQCHPGEGTSEINRWGMLLQAMTGNFQPYFSCAAVSRASGSDFVKRYGIAGKDPYDIDYFLPYHQPMTGGVAGDGCVMSPWKLPGAATGNGVGAYKVGAGGDATAYPDDALIPYLFQSLHQGVPESPLPGKCNFDQNNDGQLDVTKAYARFALMTFDSDTSEKTGLDLGGTQIDTSKPFDGMWSYLRHGDNDLFSGAWNDAFSPLPVGAKGGPVGCTIPAMQEVGARNAGAPPWEGRLIGFPKPDATLYELEAQNLQLQQTLLATRPYGATPIDGLMDDARDYLRYDPDGPKDDPYECRDKYIVLLTDGAPNLNLRPSCEGYICPYPKKAEQIAEELYSPTDGSKITTFVIGFSVNGNNVTAHNDGFPSDFSDADPDPKKKKNCKAWFDTAAGAATDDLTRAQNMETACQTRNPEAGTTGEACCQLNRIALFGSHTGAFFAESQADLVLAFGRIMANIIHSASTKTTPSFSPGAQFSSTSFATNGATNASAAQFIASYIPSSQTPWAGELDRTRYLCKGGDNISTPQAPDMDMGDFASENLAVQAREGKRLIFSVSAEPSGGNIDSAATIRPFTGTGDAIGSPTGTTTYEATEVWKNSLTGQSDLLFSTTWADALAITDKTCKSGRAVQRGKLATDRGTTLIPALDNPDDCAKVVWGFTTAYSGDLTFKGYDFNVRCFGDTGGTGKGVCSISGGDCSTTSPSCPTGETCVPLCAAMGSVYHSAPAVVGPPAGFLREEGFRNFQAKYAKRRTVTYAATTDGLLHAFDAMLQAAPSGHHELWAFAPPAVLPKLAANYPGGNQILLDGTPVVREAIWDRTTAQLGQFEKWHTTLVAGLGALGGYYALNVTDTDCSKGSGVENCLTNYEQASKGSREDVGLPVNPATGEEGSTPPKRGPHFLWQLTDIPAETGDKIVRDSTIGTTGNKVKMTALFGKNTSTPAIGMVQIKGATEERQVGIAILPGGYDDPPVTTGSCPRSSTSSEWIADALSVRTSVRRWSKDGCDAPIAGRNVTLVRLDTGEVIRVFGRKDDTPKRLQDKLKGNGGIEETHFDSPMVGTPVVYPDQPGVPIQKIFIGDADGTLWRIDVTSTDPKDWKAQLFADLISKGSAPSAAASQPIQIPPVLSTDDVGNIIIHAATGDQESIVANDSLENFVIALRERRENDGTVKADNLWFKRFTKAERVTGPMVVFDKALYFATYMPIRPTGKASDACNGPGKATLWGMHYIEPKGAATSGDGGLERWCPSSDVDAITGLCNVAYTQSEPPGSNPIQDIIPGVSLMSSQACVADGATDEYGNAAFSQVTQSQYSLSFGIARPATAGSGPPHADRKSLRQPLVPIQTQISSWSIVLE